MSDFCFTPPPLSQNSGPWDPDTFMAGTPLPQQQLGTMNTTTTPALPSYLSNWPHHQNIPMSVVMHATHDHDMFTIDHHLTPLALLGTPQYAPAQHAAIAPQQVYLPSPSIQPPASMQPASIAPQQMYLPPREITPAELNDFMKEQQQQQNGIVPTICIERWIQKDTNAVDKDTNAVVSLLGKGKRIILSPLGVFSRSPLARYRISIEENETRVRLIFDYPATCHSMSYDQLMHFLDQLGIPDFVQHMRSVVVVQQATPENQLAQAINLIVQSGNEQAMTLIDWVRFRDTLPEACYLARYLDRPVSWLPSPGKDHFYPMIAQQLKTGHGAIELYLSGIISLAELKRWAADPHRNHLSRRDCGLEPVAVFGDIELPTDVNNETVTTKLPKCLDASSSITDQDWADAKSLYEEIWQRYHAGAMIFDCTTKMSQRCFQEICLPARIFESLKEGTSFYRFCHESWDGRRIGTILSALANDISHHVTPPQPILSSLNQEAQAEQILQQLTCTRLLVVENPLGVYDAMMNEIASMARWCIEPSNLAQQLQMIKSGQLATANRHPQDGLDSLPLLVLRKVHLWTISELMRVLYEFYAKPQQPTIEPNTLDTAIRDLNRVPRLLVEMETINQQPITLLLKSSFESLAEQHPNIMAPLQMVLPPPSPSMTLRDKILHQISNRNKGFSWTQMMKHFYEEINQENGTVYVTNQPTTNDVVMVNRLADIPLWRHQSLESGPKPLCLSHALLTRAKLQPYDLYLCWSVSPNGILCIQSESFDQGLRLIFSTDSMKGLLAELSKRKK